jgi:hypothetical protein
MESTIERASGTAPARLVCETCQPVSCGLLKEQNIIVIWATDSSVWTVAHIPEELLEAYTMETVTPFKRERLERHLRSCPFCRDRLQAEI